MSGFPARTATFRTKREADRWAKIIEADMIEGKHFRNVEARSRRINGLQNRPFSNSNRSAGGASARDRGSRPQEGAWHAITRLRVTNNTA